MSKSFSMGVIIAQKGKEIEQLKKQLEISERNSLFYQAELKIADKQITELNKIKEIVNKENFDFGAPDDVLLAMKEIKGIIDERNKI